MPWNDEPDRFFESYMVGGEPSGVELGTAPVLDMWSSDVDPQADRNTIVLRGIVRRHPKYSDHTRITTSPVIWLDRNHRWARCRSRLYVLEGAEILVEGLDL